MVAHGAKQVALLEPTSREGPTIRKPIVSLMQMIDAGAEFWLSKTDGCRMYLQADHKNGIALGRVNNTLGIEGYVFDKGEDARAHAGRSSSCAP